MDGRRGACRSLYPTFKIRLGDRLEVKVTPQVAEPDQLALDAAVTQRRPGMIVTVSIRHLTVIAPCSL